LTGADVTRIKLNQTYANFNGFRVLAALLHGTPVVGVSQTLRRWTGRPSRWALAHISSLCYVRIRIVFGIAQATNSQNPQIMGQINCHCKLP